MEWGVGWGQGFRHTKNLKPKGWEGRIPLRQGGS